MSKSNKLTMTVYLDDPDGAPVSFGPDSDEVPGWAREQISNPKVWDDYEPDKSGKAPVDKGPSGAAAKAAPAPAHKPS
jgi:hypothetical protein